MTGKNPDFPGRDLLANLVTKITYPNMDEQARQGAPAGEHDAAHGAGVVNHAPPATLREELFGEEGLRTIKQGGNQGSGMDSGLKTKGVAHVEELAQRSRLARSGEFEPHKKHADMVADHFETAHQTENLPGAHDGANVGSVAKESHNI